MTEILGSVFWYIVTIGVLVTFHEYGHFFVARRCGVKVHRFSIGFGRPLWSRVGRDGTEYVLAAIPLGGYVAMLDERAEAVEPHERDQALNRKPVWQKMAVAAAGPAANVLLAVLAFWTIYLIGKPDNEPILGRGTGLVAEAGFPLGARVIAIDGQPIQYWSEVNAAVFEAAIYRRDLAIRIEQDSSAREMVLPLSGISRELPDEQLGAAIGLRLLQAARLGEIVPERPAARAGLRSGDVVLAIDGQAVIDYEHMIEVLQREGADGRARFRVRRNGSTEDLDVAPEARVEDGKSWIRIGAGGMQEYDAVVQLNPLAAVPRALADTWNTTAKSLQYLRDMVLGALSPRHVSGPIAIAQVAQLSANEGPVWFLGFLAAVSLGLAILNMLPIPILDGGHLLYYLIELIKGGPVGDRALVVGQYVGLATLAGLIGLAFFNDISGLFR